MLVLCSTRAAGADALKQTPAHRVSTGGLSLESRLLQLASARKLEAQNRWENVRALAWGKWNWLRQVTVVMFLVAVAAVRLFSSLH